MKIHAKLVLSTRTSQRGHLPQIYIGLKIEHTTYSKPPHDRQKKSGQFAIHINFEAEAHFPETPFQVPHQIFQNSGTGTIEKKLGITLPKKGRFVSFFFLGGVNPKYLQKIERSIGSMGPLYVYLPTNLPNK